MRQQETPQIIRLEVGRKVQPVRKHSNTKRQSLRPGKRPPTTDQAPDGPVTHLSKNNFKATPRQLTDNSDDTTKLEPFYFQSS
jgi:hypothetical protein